MKLSRLKLAVLLSTAAVFSCSDPICGCSQPLPYAFLSGQVTDAEGMPVMGAVVHARVGNAACDGSFRSLGVPSGRTDASGRYRTSVYLGAATVPGECMEAWAEPPTGVAARASEPVRFAVRFGYGAETADSVRIDHQLRAIEQEMTLWVAPNDVACTGTHPMRCLLVRESAEAPWSYFYDSIAGFAWEPGYTYQLRVIRSTIRQPLADQGAYRYRLIQIVEKR